MNNENNNKKQLKPKTYLILKIVGFSAAILTVAFFILAFTTSDFGPNPAFMFPAMFGIFVTLSTLMFGFSPEIAKLNAKHTKYIMQENKQDLTDIANTSADISKGAAKTVSKEVFDGYHESKNANQSAENTAATQDCLFCHNCGKKLRKNAKFCSGCGTKI